MMLASIARLFLLRPFLTMAILGIPVAILIAVGLFTIMALKFFIYIVLPIIVVVWILKKIFGRDSSTA